ncbi:WecB/TagA/CpsF family glycosyltransferase [Singulisphaera sp. Ch08]|uniref:WecB/TagA/CpsF family glycosyltransferase n=1 Tax=Singulisphaera sp. Ch08 TaxID=3120278 RepID=A0AAU7CE42_9BACT
MSKPVRIWGIPFTPMTRPQAVEAIMALAEAGRPSYFITANLHYAMLTHQHPVLGSINERAAFVLADGAPIVWASRWQRTPLPERVAGSDLIFDLCEEAAARGLRPFLLGGAEGVAEAAARRLEALYPGLRVAGTACPPHRDLEEEEFDRLIARIREAQPDLLFVAFGQPKGELWIDSHLERLGVPVCVQVGASLDFVAGRVRRAPLWVQRISMEWAYRLSLEPRRLGPRYASNALFLLRMIAHDLASWNQGERSARPIVSGDVLELKREEFETG